MTLRRHATVAVMVATLLWAGTAFAEVRGPGARGMGWGGAILRSVGLTDAQKAQVHQIISNHRAQFRALGGQLRTVQGQLGDRLSGTDAVTAGDLAPLSQQLDQLRSQLAQERLQVALEIRGVLTPDQLAKAAEIRRQLNQLRSQMRTLLFPAP